jgi:transcriptional antiterminator NusG
MAEETTVVESNARWYVVHTYSGYENKVKDNLEKTIENRQMHDIIQEVNVPVEEVLEMKNNRKKLVQRKIFPGYVLVKMIMTDDSWYVVRNTRGVTGFVGPGSKPVPLTDEEVRKMGVENVRIKIDISVGEMVKVVSGPMDGFVGEVTEIDSARQKVKVLITMFGRETPVELDFVQVDRQL